MTFFNNLYIPVVIYNLRGYDSHLIIKKAFEINEQIGNRKIDGIPNRSEKFTSFSIGNLQFIASMQFMASSLESLVNNLYNKENKHKHFTHMNKYFPEHIELLCQKNTYPYELCRPYTQAGPCRLTAERGLLLLAVHRKCI